MTKESKGNIILAADVSMGEYQVLLDVLGNEPGIFGIKVGFALGLRATLQAIVHMTKQVNPSLQVIYDHQKACTDVPFTGRLFADVMLEAKVDAAILFPLTGPATQKDWIDYLHSNCITALVGGAMTHVHYMQHEGGYIDVNAIAHMYAVSAKKGITDFVMPGNRPDLIYSLIDIVLNNGCSEDNLTIYSPGISSMSDLMSACSAAKPYDFYPIIGRWICEANNPLTLVRDIHSKMWRHK